MNAPFATRRAKRNSPVQAVDRAAHMLCAFTMQEQRLRVTDFADLLGVHKSTASRLAATLEAHGFLERAPGDAFRLGPEVSRLGLLAISGRDLVGAARVAMERLAAATGETVTLSIREGAEATTITQVNGRYIIGATTWVGKRTPLHATSDGKVLLAFGTPELNLNDAPLEPLTKRTITRPDRLALQLRRVRRTRWAGAVGELEVGLNGVASPIFDTGERCVAALSVSGPIYRVPPKRFAELATLCQEASEEISARLGRTRGAA